MTVLYEYKSALYMNITNKCPCSCVFCIRSQSDGVNIGENLWLETEPTIEQIKAEIDKRDLSIYSEIVFCGFGEPTERLDVLIEISRYLKEKANVLIRLNTNGLGDLINKKPIAELLAPYIDSVSISLNAPTKEEYFSICRPIFGEKSFEAMLNFAKEMHKYIDNVIFTIVDVLDIEKQVACQKICDEIKIPLKIRKVI